MTLGLQYIHDFGLSTWCSGYHYCTTSFNKAWTQVLRRFKPCSRRVGDSRWWGSLTMVPAGNKAKRLSSVNHTTKTIHKFINSFIIDFGFDIFSDILKKIYFFDSEIHNLWHFWCTKSLHIMLLFLFFFHDSKKFFSHYDV